MILLRTVISLVIAILTCVPSAASADPSELLPWLRSNETRRIAEELNSVQSSFERGATSEYELRNAFRPLYVLDPVSLKNLQNWVASEPRSYIAHLALGIHYKRVGVQVRGDKYIANTPQKNIDLMEQYFRSAEYELRTSMALARQPYLNLFHLVDIYGMLGHRKQLNEVLNLAVQMRPSNELVRMRYAKYLTPRWGGSYPQLEAYIEGTKKQGVSESLVWQLKAFQYFDLGETLAEQGDAVSARKQYRKALALSDRFGEDFRGDQFEELRRLACEGANSEPPCK